ncbi:MAG: hypothetical protein LBU40_03365, partial [Methanobrevibacter sp.]|nr:hypothetical protein [Methanobrevibacter sp.]
MFKLQTDNVVVLKSIFNAITSIIGEVEIEINENELLISELDMSHMLFINLKLNKFFFDEYNCESDTRFILDSKQLMNVLKTVKVYDNLILTEEENNVLLILENESRNVFKLEKVNYPSKKVNPPILEGLEEFEVNLSVFKGFINRISKQNKLNTHVKISVDETHLTLESRNINISYIHGENINNKIECKYSLEYLINMLKTTKLSDTIKL